MTQLALVGDFCPNPDCEYYGDVEAKIIIRYGKTKDGRQRYQCKSCKKTFNERSCNSTLATGQTTQCSYG